MVSLIEYLENPCGTLSIPYWKSRGLVLPESIRIVHQRAFSDRDLAGCAAEVYFRLLHTLEHVEPVLPGGFYVKTATREDIPLMVELINRSYDDLSVTCERLLHDTTLRAYDATLWIIAYDAKTSLAVGCGIADFDKETREGSLEWIQVLPEFRGKGAGKLLVNELLSRMAGRAAFATVSGRVDSPTNPERLYRRCGFTGDDVWHILYEKRT